MDVTVEEEIAGYLAKKRPEWGDQHYNQVETQLVAQADVLQCLEPHWHDETTTMSPVRYHLEAVLDRAAAKGHRVGDNPGAWKSLTHSLSDPKKIHTVANFENVPYPQIAGSMAKSRDTDRIAARALEFLILTATRTDEVREAQWSEIGWEEKAWLIAAFRVKNRTFDHRVPLTEPALKILKALHAIRTKNPFIFAGHRTGGPVNGHAMQRVVDEIIPPTRDAEGKKIAGPTVHGFRSSFATWAEEQTSTERDLIKKALGHTIGDETQRAYLRGELFDKRRVLMLLWSEWVNGSNVVPFAKTA
jgi:hypothetical protein